MNRLSKYFVYIKNLRWLDFFLASFVLLVIIFGINFFSFASNTDKIQYKDYFSDYGRVFDLNLPKDLNFAGEKVPQTDFGIRESVDKEFLTSTYWRGHIILMVKRSNRWFPVIEPILKKYGLPDDLKYIALAESHLTNSTSPQNAVGFWQLIEPTAANYGLEINDEVDERYSIERSTEAACKFFKEAYRKFGNWTLAAASYNLGMGGIEMQLKKQKVDNYYDLYLNEETGRYVYRVLALKAIIQSPTKYGINLRKQDLYKKIPVVSFKVDSTIHNLVDFSISLGYNFRILKLFNPWLRSNQLSNPERKVYTIQFPNKKYMDETFDDEEREVLRNDLKIDTALLKIRKDTGIVTQRMSSGVIHTVKEGETWITISTNYNVKPEQIRMWNILDEKTELKPGMEFVIFPNQEEDKTIDQKKKKHEKKKN